jgi:hypothetical protein
MPRLSGKNPAYRKHKATGQAVVTLSDRDVYLGPHGTKASKDEYDRRMREWNAASGVLKDNRPGDHNRRAAQRLLETREGLLRRRGRPAYKRGREIQDVDSAVHEGVRANHGDKVRAPEAKGVSANAGR